MLLAAFASFLHGYFGPREAAALMLPLVLSVINLKLCSCYLKRTKVTPG